MGYTHEYITTILCFLKTNCIRTLVNRKNSIVDSGKGKKTFSKYLINLIYYANIFW